MATPNNNQNQMTYEKAIALRESGKPLSKKQIWEITDLGYDYYYGKRGKMKRDPEKGVELFTISAEQGDAVAQFDLGLAYDDGVGVEEIDWDKAARGCGARPARSAALVPQGKTLGQGGH